MASSAISWEQLRDLPVEYQEKLVAFYAETSLDFDIRISIADWIENQPWFEKNKESILYQDFINQVETLIQELKFPRNIQIKQWLDTLKSKYEKNVQLFVSDVRNCLTMELDIIRSAQADAANRMDLDHEDLVYHRARQAIKKTIEDKLQEAQKMIERPLKDCSQFHTDLTENRAKRQKVDDQNVQTWASNQLGVCDILRITQQHVLGEIQIWKRQQQLSQNGHTYPSNLDDIEKWCQSLYRYFDMLMKNLDSLSQGAEFGCAEVVQNQKIQVQHLMDQLVKYSLIVERQPPQMIKKSNQLTLVTLRWLVGDLSKVIQGFKMPEIQALIITEDEARQLQNEQLRACDIDRQNMTDCKGKIQRFRKEECVYSFAKLKVKDFQRQRSETTKTVLEEKFAVLFKAIGSDVWTMSLPVTILTHTTQESSVLPVIMWDNEFAEPNRQYFSVPDSVKWPQLVKMLSLKFNEQTGAHLSPDHRKFLAHKLLGDCEDYTEMEVTWQKFYVEKMGGGFTFWEWFHDIMKLTKDHFAEMWRDKLIAGFINKDEAERQLLSCRPGTFLLRFSSQHLGGISIVLVKQSKDKSLCCKHFAPFDATLLKKTPLANIIYDTKSHKYLYPDIPKQKAFEKYKQTTDDFQKRDIPGYIGYQLSSDMNELKLADDSDDGEVDVTPEEQVSMETVASTRESPSGTQQLSGFLTDSNGVMNFQDTNEMFNGSHASSPMWSNLDQESNNSLDSGLFDANMNDLEQAIDISSFQGLLDHVDGVDFSMCPSE